MPAVQLPVGTGPPSTGTMRPTAQQQLDKQAIHNHGISDSSVSGGPRQVIDAAALVAGAPRAPSDLPSPIGSFQQQGQPLTQRLVAVSAGVQLQHPSSSRAAHSHNAAALAGGTLMVSNPDAIAAAPAAMQTYALQHQAMQQQQQQDQPLLLAFPYMGHAGDAPGALGYPQHTAATPGSTQQQPAVLGLVPASTAPPAGRQVGSWTRLLEAARSAPPPADLSRGKGSPAVSMGRADGAVSCRLLPPRLLPGALPSHGHTLQPGAMMQQALGSSSNAVVGVFDNPAAAAAAAGGVTTCQALHTLLPAVAGSCAGAEGSKRALPGACIACPMDVSSYDQPLSDPLVSRPLGSGGLHAAAGLLHLPAPGGQAVPGSNPAEAEFFQADFRPGKRAKASAAGSILGQQQRVGARASADTQTQDQGSPAAAALTGTVDPQLLPARHEPLQPLLQVPYPGHLQQLGPTQLSNVLAAEQQQQLHPLMHQGGGRLATADLARGQLATATLNGGQLAVAALQVLSVEQLLHQPRERVQQHARLQLQRMLQPTALQPPAAGPVPGSPEAAAVQQLKQHISSLQRYAATAAGTAAGAAAAAAGGTRIEPAAVSARQEADAEGADFCDELLLLWSVTNELGLLDAQQADVLDRLFAELLLQEAEQPLLPHQCDLLQQAAAAFMKPYEQHPEHQPVLQLLAEHLLLLGQLALQQQQRGQLQPEVLSGQQQRLRQHSAMLQAQVGLAQQQQQQQQQLFSGAQGRLAAHQGATDPTQASRQHAAPLQAGTGGVEATHSQQLQPQLYMQAHPHHSTGNPAAAAAAAAAMSWQQEQQQQQQEQEEGEEELLHPSAPQGQLQEAVAAAANGSYTGVYPKAGGNWKTQISLGKLAYLAVCETPEDAARKWNEAASFKGVPPNRLNKVYPLYPPDYIPGELHGVTGTAKDAFVKWAKRPSVNKGDKLRFCSTGEDRFNLWWQE